MQVQEALRIVLDRECDLLDELIALGQQKRENINNEKQVAMIAAKEDKILQRLQKAEAERQALFDVVAPGKTLQEWLKTGGSVQEALRPAATALQEKFGVLRDLNDTNMQLVEESLAFIRFSLNLLNTQSPSTYSPKGPSDGGGSFFNRKV